MRIVGYFVEYRKKRSDCDDDDDSLFTWNLSSKLLFRPKLFFLHNDHHDGGGVREWTKNRGREKEEEVYFSMSLVLSWDACCPVFVRDRTTLHFLHFFSMVSILCGFLFGL